LHLVGDLFESNKYSLRFHLFHVSILAILWPQVLHSTLRLLV